MDIRPTKSPTLNETEQERSKKKGSLPKHVSTQLTREQETRDVPTKVTQAHWRGGTLITTQMAMTFKTNTEPYIQSGSRFCASADDLVVFRCSHPRIGARGMRSMTGKVVVRMAA